MLRRISGRRRGRRERRSDRAGSRANAIASVRRARANGARAGRIAGGRPRRSEIGIGDDGMRPADLGMGPLAQRPDGIEIGRDRVRCDLLIELIAEDNHILELVGEHRLIRALVVPELGFPQEVEPGLLHHPGCPSELIGAEKDGRAEDALEGRDQATIFCAAFMHTEDLQHLPGAPEPNDLALLLNCQRCQEDRHNTILPKWHAELGMPGDLQHELAIALLIHQLACRQSSHGQATQDKWPGSKAEFLGPLLPVHLDKMNSARFAKLLFRDNELAMGPPENGRGLLEATVRG